ncbi:hypothetical protein HRTV-11_gp105 [Halorubrum virus HRTV-11]|nr:hypothetical protein HRTV-11_gp105 [Halorubrum virus HRTV-11]
MNPPRRGVTENAQNGRKYARNPTGGVPFKEGKPRQEPANKRRNGNTFGDEYHPMRVRKVARKDCSRR